MWWPTREQPGGGTSSGWPSQGNLECLKVSAPEGAVLVPVCWGQHWLGLLSAREESACRTRGRLDEATTGPGRGRHRGLVRHRVDGREETIILKIR